MTLGVIDYVFIGFTLFCCVFSYFTGFMKRISGLVALIVSFFAVNLAWWAIQTYDLLTASLPKSLVCGLLMIVSFVLIKWMLRKFSKALSKTLVAGTADKILGFLAGLLIAFIVVSVASILMYLLRPASAEESLIIRAFTDIFHI